MILRESGSEHLELLWLLRQGRDDEVKHYVFIGFLVTHVCEQRLGERHFNVLYQHLFCPKIPLLQVKRITTQNTNASQLCRN